MRWTRVIGALSVLGSVCALAAAQDHYAVEQERPQRKQAIPEAGLWPTDRMIDLFIDRMTEEMGRGFDFDDDQLYTTRELFKERFPRWLSDNRGELMQLTNDYLEALMGDQAPEVDWVAGWALRALPLLDDLAGLVEEVTDDMRPYLTDTQQSMLEGQLAMFRVGTSGAAQRLGAWSEGGFDAETEWFRSEKFPEAERQRRDDLAAAQHRAKLEAQGIAVDEPGTGPHEVAGAEPRSAASRAPRSQDKWRQYVESFIRRYDLNETQQADAYKHLRFQQEQRDRYLRRKGAMVAQAKEALRAAKTEQQRSLAEQASARLNRPLERMFTQLKEKLNQIPTRKQRVAAAQAARQPSPQKAPTTAGAGSQGSSTP